MKILHISDLHLGKRLDRFDRLPEQKAVMQEFISIAETENPDIVLIAGDLFDTFNPPVEAIELLYHSLRKLTGDGIRPVIAIAGNHDSPDRVEVPDSFARELGIIFCGYPKSEIRPFETDHGVCLMKSAPGFIELKLPRTDYPVRVIHTAYANEWRLREELDIDNSAESMRSALEKHWNHHANDFCDTNGVNLLVAHLFFMNEGGQIPEEPEGERSIMVGGAEAIYPRNIPSQIQYVALGHLHRMHFVSESPCPIVYSGSPIGYSFAEAGQEKFAVIVEVNPNETTRVKKIRLNAGYELVRKTFESVHEASEWLTQNPDCFVELSIRTETYLSAEDRKALHSVHQRIIGPLPILLNPASDNESQNEINLSAGMEELFRQYFFSEKNQQPDDSLMDLFREVLSQDGGRE